MDNGALKFIPGSHRIPLAPGQMDALDFLRPEVAENQALFAQGTTPVLERGDVVLFHSKLFHAAGRNTSTQMKASVVFAYRGESKCRWRGRGRQRRGKWRWDEVCFVSTSPINPLPPRLRVPPRPHPLRRHHLRKRAYVGNQVPQPCRHHAHAIGQRMHAACSSFCTMGSSQSP